MSLKTLWHRTRNEHKSHENNVQLNIYKNKVSVNDFELLWTSIYFCILLWTSVYLYVYIHTYTCIMIKSIFNRNLRNWFQSMDDLFQFLICCYSYGLTDRSYSFFLAKHICYLCPVNQCIISPSLSRTISYFSKHFYSNITAQVLLTKTEQR